MTQKLHDVEASREVISSLSNPRVKALRKLARRGERERAGEFLAEGHSVVAEAVASGNVLEIFITTGTKIEPPGDVPVLEVTDDVLRSMSTTTTPQGVVARVLTPDTSLERIPLDAKLVLVLADVRDPGNAGTLVRSAVAAGADAVVFIRGSVDPYSPKTVRSSAGGIFRLPIAIAPLDEVIDLLRGRGFSILGTAARAEGSLDDVPADRPVALVLGNEAWGMSDEVRGLVDSVVSIEMPGPAESLNVAIAGSILLFDIARKESRHPRRAGEGTS